MTTVQLPVIFSDVLCDFVFCCSSDGIMELVLRKGDLQQCDDSGNIGIQFLWQINMDYRILWSEIVTDCIHKLSQSE